MPLFEYHCRDCGQQFEILTLGGTSEPVPTEPATTTEVPENFQ